MSSERPLHWADQSAARIARERGIKPTFVCAAGISPSGTVHIGNFREIISVDLVVRALRSAGHRVRFLYFWDDMDALRAVPANFSAPDARERLKRHLREPIGRLPDPIGQATSYARRNEIALEQELPRLGIRPEFIYQEQRYAADLYAGMIRQALRQRDTIRTILNRHRQRPLPADWWPISIFSGFTGRDTTTIEDWDGEWTLTYRCNETDQRESIDLRSDPHVKLLWRVDWPMRWAYEKVDFEPAGKDHHTAGGAFATAKEIVSAVYDETAPVSFQYDFIRIKGYGGKMSSSSGTVIDVAEVLRIYQPQVVRYLFSSTKPNGEFAISFDMDVVKVYEDYDRCARIYFGQETVSEERAARERRIYELAQVGEQMPQAMPLCISFRHVCSLVQIVAGDIEFLMANLSKFGISSGSTGPEAQDCAFLKARAICAWNWVRHYAPDSMRFQLRTGDEPPIALDMLQRTALRALCDELNRNWATYDEKSLAVVLYEMAHANNMQPKEFFMLLYTMLISKSHGPRLASFIRAIGRERTLELLERY